MTVIVPPPPPPNVPPFSPRGNGRILVKPTPEELLAEIQSGPLAGDCAPLVATGQDNALADLLNDRTKCSRPVPRVMSLIDLVPPVIAAESVAAVFSHPRFTDLRDTLNKQDRAGVVAMATLFAALGVITGDDLATVTAYVGGTVAVSCSAMDAKGWESTTPDAVARAFGRG